MDIEEIQEEVDDLVFFLEIDTEILLNEITKYIINYQFYYNNIINNMNPNNYIYLIRKLRNLVLSFNQLIYEARNEHMFWNSIIELSKNENFVNIFEDIIDEIEEINTIFSEQSFNRLLFFDEYNQVFNNYLKNHLVIDDEYFLSDMDETEYKNKLNDYNKRLELFKTKK